PPPVVAEHWLSSVHPGKHPLRRSGLSRSTGRQRYAVRQSSFVTHPSRHTPPPAVVRAHTPSPGHPGSAASGSQPGSVQYESGKPVSVSVKHCPPWHEPRPAEQTWPRLLGSNTGWQVRRPGTSIASAHSQPVRQSVLVAHPSQHTPLPNPCGRHCASSGHPEFVVGLQPITTQVPPG